MADLTTIFVAGIGALATVANGAGGYWLARHNEAARDERTAQREEANRAAALAERLQDRRYDWQRQVLLELQDELQKLARLTGKILMEDQKTVREHGKIFRLPEGLGGEASLAVTVAVQKLRSRILADDLRALVGDFVNSCSYASTGYIAEHKNDPREALESLFINLEAQLGARYQVLVEQLGEHIRRNEGQV
jgi:hypothetical protein